MDKINNLINQLTPDSPICQQQENGTQCKIDAINANKGTLKGEHCDICNDKGFVAILENDVIVTRRCKCMNKREALRLIKASGLEQSFEKHKLENYQTPKQWQKEALENAKDYISNPVGWFLAVGGVGSGKTHLCTAICGELINKNIAVRYFKWRTDAPKLKGLVNSREEYEPLIEPLKCVRCLYIDDFLKGSVSDGDKNLAFEILNERYNNPKLLTIISSEKTITEILDIDEAVGSRIYEQSKAHLVQIGKNENWRLR